MTYNCNSHATFKFMYVYICIYILHTYVYIHTHIHIHIYIKPFFLRCYTMGHISKKNLYPTRHSELFAKVSSSVSYQMLLGYEFFFFVHLTPGGGTKHQFAYCRHSYLASMMEMLEHDTWTIGLKPGLMCHYKFNRRNLAIWSKSQQSKSSLFPTKSEFPSLFCQH